MAQQRVAIVLNGVVDNTIIADPATYKDPGGGSLVASDAAQIGWTYDGTSFTAPTPAQPTAAELLAYASQRQNTILGANIWSFNVGTESAPLVVTTYLNATGQAAMTQLLLWSVMIAGPDDTEAYSNVDLSTATLTPAQAKSLATQAGAVKSASFVVLNQLVDEISASPPTVTTEGQIDAAAWPVSDASAAPSTTASSSGTAAAPTPASTSSTASPSAPAAST